MEIPGSLDGWDLAKVGEVAFSGLPETDRYDFKTGMATPENISKLCCAFANSRGGFVIFGVTSVSNIWLVQGIPRDPEISAKFGQRVKASPAIEFPPPKLIDVADPTRAIYIFHIPQSAARPHIQEPEDRRTFWKRTNTGCERMSRDEIEAQFVGLEQQRRLLGLLVAELSDAELLVKEFRTQGLQSRMDLNSDLLLEKFEATILSSSMADPLSPIQRDAELLEYLRAVRRYLGRMNRRAEIYFGARAIEPSNEFRALQYIAAQRRDSEHVSSPLNQAVNRLCRLFDLTRPTQ